MPQVSVTKSGNATVPLHYRVPASTREIIRELAEAEGLTASSWVRRATMRAVQRALHERESSWS